MGWDARKKPADAPTVLLQTYGDRHERAYLQVLKGRGLEVVEIDKSATLEVQVKATRAAMFAGADVIFQATLLQPPFLGYADFLIKVEGPSKLGNYHYEVADTKLAKSNRAKFMVQLCFYADLLEKEQGVLPQHLHVVLGTLVDQDREMRGMAPDAENITKLRTQDYIHYVRSIKANFIAFVASEPITSPVPVSACGQCGWESHCSAHWESVDHLSRVANIRSAQAIKLEMAGISTMKTLSTSTADLKGLSTLPKLRLQADLQCNPKDAQGNARIEYLEPNAEKASGFQLLPAPNPGDLYFDMEEFPHEPGGLEYLFGLGYVEAGDTHKFKFVPFWAHNRAEEKLAFEQFMDFVETHLGKYPAAHIYHYAPYEKTAIQRLTSMHNTRTEMHDRLRREGRLIDLYKVVSSGLILAVPSYSIKKVESYYRDAREGEVANAGDSIVQYQAFRVADNDADKAKLLNDIESYNYEDVESTRQLHVWLESIKPKNTMPFVKPTLVEQEEASRQLKRTEREVKEQAARQALTTWVERQPMVEQAEFRKVAELLGQLLGGPCQHTN